MHQKDNAMVGKTNAVCFVCLLNRRGMFTSPPTILLLDTPISKQKNQGTFAGAPRATLIIMKSVFIISTALECIVISVSAPNFF
jgi:hypothetical protein